MSAPIGKINLKSKKKRTLSSRLWLERQLNDPYVRKAKSDGYRSRAAYKLIEIDQKFKLLKNGLRVIDLGAAPGGWSQVIAEKIKAKGTVVALDIQDLAPISDNITIIKGDFETSEVQSQLSKLIDKADLIVSDMAASACGIPTVDHLRIMNLLEAALEFTLDHLEKNGAFVAKVLRGGTEGEILKKLKNNFRQVSHFKPNSSRQDSSEMYLVAKGFKGKINVEKLSVV